MVYLRLFLVACLFFVTVIGVSVRVSVAGSPKHRPVTKRQRVRFLGAFTRSLRKTPVLLLRTAPKHSKTEKALRKLLHKALGKVLSRYTKEVRANRVKNGCLRLRAKAQGRKGWLRFLRHKHVLKSQVVRNAIFYWLNKNQRAVQSILQHFRPNQPSIELLIGFSVGMFGRGCPVLYRSGFAGEKGFALGGGRLGMRGTGRGGGGGEGFGTIGHKGRAPKRRPYQRAKRRRIVSFRAYQILSLRLRGKIERSKVRNRLRYFVRRTRRCLQGRVGKKLQPIQVFLSIRYGRIVKMRLSSELRTLYFNRFCLRRRVSKEWSKSATEQGTISARLILPIL